MIKKTGSAILVAGLCLLFLFVLPASAQEGQPDVGDSGSVTEAELDQAAKAYAKITEVRQDFQQSLQEAENQEQIQNLQARANQKMTKAVEEEGLDVQSYNKIIQAVKMDEELREDFMNKLENIQ